MSMVLYLCLVSDSLLFSFLFSSPFPVLMYLFVQETKIDCVRVATKGRNRSDCVTEDVLAANI